MKAAIRTFGVAGGVLGGMIGPRATLLVAGLGTLSSVTWIALSPLRKVHSLPEYAPE